MKRVHGDTENGYERANPLSRQSIRRQVNAVDAGGEGDVQPIIHQDTSPGAGRQIANLAYEFEEFFSGQILFANLDHIDAFTHGTVSEGDDVALTPIGDIVANHFSDGCALSGLHSHPLIPLCWSG